MMNHCKLSLLRTHTDLSTSQETSESEQIIWQCSQISYYHRLLLSTLLAMAMALLSVPALATTSNSSGLSVHVVQPISEDLILPTTFPLPGEPSTTLQMSASRGEYEPASFVVRARDESFTSIMVTASNLLGKHSTIDKKNIDIKIVKVWYQAAGAWNSHRRRRNEEKILVPELLVNDPDMIKLDTSQKHNYIKLRNESGHRYQLISENRLRHLSDMPLTTDFPVRDTTKLQPASIPEGTNLQYWVTIYVPKDSQPGEYTGTISFTDKPKGPIFKKLAIKIEVLPFELAKPLLEYSLYYRGKLAPKSPTVSSEFKSEKQLRAELINMREHGVKNPTIYQRYRPKNDLVPTTVKDSQRLLKHHLAIRHELGMTNGPMYYLGRSIGFPVSQKGINKLNTDIRNLIGIGKKFSFTKLFLYGKDEARGQELLRQKNALKLVHGGGAKVFSAGYKGHFDTLGGLTDLLIFHGTPDPYEAKKVHGGQNRIFSYSNPQAGPENPLMFRKNYGIKLWQAGFDGAMDYAYQHSMGSIWNDFDHKKYRDLVLAYPTVDGVIDTIAWEGFREAIDDVRYLTTLIHLIQELENDDEFTQEIHNATQYISHLKMLDKFDPQVTRTKLIELILSFS